MNDSCHSTSPRAPDPILAELWDVKRQINEQAGYRLDELTRLAEAAAAEIRRRWSQDGRSATAP
jgi:hypothetical protein